MLEFTTDLSIKDCEKRFNTAINSFPKKQSERNKIDCFRGKIKNDKLSIIFSRPLNYPYNRLHGNIALVGNLYNKNSKTYIKAKFVSPVLIKSFYIPYFIVVFIILALYGVSTNVAALELYKELTFFILIYISLIFLSKSNSTNRMDKTLEFLEKTMSLTRVK